VLLIFKRQQHDFAFELLVSKSWQLAIDDLSHYFLLFVMNKQLKGTSKNP